MKSELEKIFRIPVADVYVYPQECNKGAFELQVTSKNSLIVRGRVL